MTSTPKILIIGPGRTGTTTLTNAISSILKLSDIHEPWNYREPADTQIKYPEDIKNYGVIKCLPNQIPYQFRGSKSRGEVGTETLINFYVELQKYFDYTILLNRRQRIEIAKSAAYQRQYGGTGTWHEQYFIPDESKLDLSNFDWIDSVCDLAEELSTILDTPITWYEDLYSGDKKLISKVIKKWGFNIDLESLYEYIDPKHRYRKTDKKQIINKVI